MLQEKNNIKPVIYDSVRTHARTHTTRRGGRRCRAAFGRAWVMAGLRSKSSTLRRGALREEPGLTAVAFSLSILSHLHLGFAFRPRQHLLAQAVHQVAPAGRAARIQRVFLVLPRGRPPESSSNARYSKLGSISKRLMVLVLAALRSEPCQPTTTLMAGSWERRSASLVSS